MNCGFISLKCFAQCYDRDVMANQDSYRRLKMEISTVFSSGFQCHIYVKWDDFYQTTKTS